MPTDPNKLKMYDQAVTNGLAYGDIGQGVDLGQVGHLAMGAASAHPLATASMLGLGGMNLGGLTDNNKFGGQLAGALGGALISNQIGGFAQNPLWSAGLTMGGGALGSLFDKLRAKKEAERKAQTYQGGR